MMIQLFLLWVFLCTIFLGVPAAYYFYMRWRASKPWGLRINKDYTPLITILISAYNEERTIGLKLENLLRVKYPKEKIQILLVNDGSTDETLEEIYNFQNSNPSLNIEVLNNTERVGKSASLNLALKKAAGDVIIVSDADCFWSPDILVKGLPYLSDPTVGGITGLELLLNPRESWVTQTEIAYNNSVHIIRVGESKAHSTIFFQGGFSAYKREVLSEFDCQNDDSGTALNIVQKNVRTLLIPGATYFTTFPSSWKGKIVTKIRRATQLMTIWVKCLKLSLRRQLILPKKIFLTEAFLYILNPIIFIILMGLTLLLLLDQPFFLLVFPIFILPIFLVKKTRTFFVEIVQDNLILLSALFASIFNKRFTFWETADSSRYSLTREMLEKQSLV